MPATVAPVRRRRVLFNAAALVSASLWRTALTFVQFWFIARALGVEALGQYALGMAYLNVAAIASEFGLPNLLVRDLAQEPAHRRSRFGQLLLIQVIFALVTWALVVLLVGILPLSAVVRQAILVGAPFLPFYAVTSVGLTLCRASERMDLVLLGEVVGSTLMLVGSVIMIQRGSTVVGLFGVQVAVQVAVAALMVAVVVLARLLRGRQEHAPLALAQLLRRALPFYGVALAEVLLQRFDVILLGMVATDAVVGVFAAANNLLRVLNKVVQSVWSSLYPTLSRLRHAHQETYRSLVSQVLRLSNLTLLPTAVLAAVLAPELLHLLYGSDFAGAVPVLRIIVVSVIFYAYEVSSMTVLMVERAPQRGLYILLAHLLILAVGVPLLGQRAGATGAAVAVLASGAIGAGVGIALSWPFVRLRDPHLVHLLLAVTAAVLVTIFLPAPWLVQLAAGVAVYGLIAWRLGCLDIVALPRLRELIAAGD